MSAQQQLDAMGGIDMSIPVRAVNRSDREVVWQYDRKKYVLQPGVPTYVPYMAMVLYQGDPRAIDLPGGRAHEQHRRQAREHLRVLYGVYEHEERWSDIPLVECYPIDSDVRFETVLHDPDGTHLTGKSEAMSQQVQLAEMVERQAAQLRAMQAQLASIQQQDAAREAAGLDPNDLDREETAVRGAVPEGQSMVGPAPERRPVPKGGVATRDAGPAVTRDGE